MSEIIINFCKFCLGTCLFSNTGRVIDAFCPILHSYDANTDNTTTGRGKIGANVVSTVTFAYNEPYNNTATSRNYDIRSCQRCRALFESVESKLFSLY